MSAEPIVSTAVPTTSWRDFHSRERFVQCYEDDSVLIDAVTAYVMKGFAAGAAAVIVATRSVRKTRQKFLPRADRAGVQGWDADPFTRSKNKNTPQLPYC